jgi:site-specific recombinase XerD
VRQFVTKLRNRGVVAAGPVVSPTEIPLPLIGFRAWLSHHRGLAQRTIDHYEDRIATMLPALGSDPSRYNARLVRRVILAESRDRHRAYTKTFVTALRAFLRFLAVQGKCPPYLDRAVPTIREWKLSALPRYLEAEDVERVIASCDRNRTQGVRDRAVLLLLARLGLRAGDIVALRVDDFDWSRGTVRVCGKGKKEVRLPLPQETGDAVLEYLQSARPCCDHQRLFLCINAPIRPFAASSVVAAIVRSAIERAGIPDPPSKGAHLLRHSAATTMLRSGVSLDTVVTVLRHESSDMTAHYAKVDLALLERVAQPWPEGTSC